MGGVWPGGQAHTPPVAHRRSPLAVQRRGLASGSAGERRMSMVRPASHSDIRHLAQLPTRGVTPSLLTPVWCRNALRLSLRWPIYRVARIGTLSWGTDQLRA